MPDARKPTVDAEPQQRTASHMEDDYYHYYMASQKRVSRWISQTSKELETATPLPVPELYHGHGYGGGPPRLEEPTDTAGTTSTMVASTSRSQLDSASTPERSRREQDTRDRRRDTGEEREKGREKTRSKGKERDGKERKGSSEESKEKERLRRSKSRLEEKVPFEEENERRRDRRDAPKERPKRTSSMSPPPSTFKPKVSGNALALDLFAGADSTVVTTTRVSSNHIGSAEDLYRHRMKESTDAKAKELERERLREMQRLRDPPPETPKDRGRGEEWLVLERKLREKAERRVEASQRSKSRATTQASRRSTKQRSPSPGGIDFSSTSFQALLVLLSSSMLMIAVAPKLGIVMSVAVGGVMVVVLNMPSDEPHPRRKRSRSIDSTRMPKTLVTRGPNS